MFRCLQNQTSNSKIIFYRNDPTCIPFLNLSRFSPLKKQRVFTRHNFFAFLAAEPTPVEKVEHGQLYYDNYDNIRITTPVRWPIDARRFITGPNEEKIMSNLKSGQWIPVEDEMPYNFKVEGVKIRKKEDGMFVNFTFQVDQTQKEKALKEINQRVQTFLEDKRGLFFDMRAYLVKGEPFIEELIDRYPASRLRVEFQGPEILTETLYEYFEQYGLIRDIKLYPASPKDLFPYALVQYSKLRSAICAKNCVHGMSVNGTRLNIIYDRPIKMLRIYIWIVNHPTLSTISLPLIPFIAVAIVAGITYGLDLACYLLIKSNIMYNHLYQQFKEKTTNLLMFFREKLEEDHLDFSTKEQEDKLRNWLKDPPENFIVLIGPTNSGKSTIINRILQGKRNTVFIKCDDILYSRDKNERALELAKQVGCSPVFNVVISLSKLGNLLADEVIGHKIFGLPSTIDDPIKKILEMLENALTKRTRRIQRVSDITEGRSEEYPIVVIDAYMIKHKENHESHELWDILIKFATQLVKKKLAHVMFVSSNIGISDHLKIQVPSVPVNTLDLHDLNEVMNFVDKYSRDKKFEFHDGLKEAVSNIGLHLTDLGVFFKKIHSGAKPDDALKNLINEAKTDVYKLAFNDDKEFAKNKWSDIQFWEIMKGLSKEKNKYLFYDIVKSSPIFNDNDAPIRAMEHAGLISITQLQNEYSVTIIKASKLLYQKAFEEISKDKLFDTKMKYKKAQYNLALENHKIKEYEFELERLAKIDRNWNNNWSFGWWWFGSSRNVIDFRVKFLLSGLKKSLSRAKKYQKQIDELKQIYESTLNEKATS